jgi:hypothetical protein
VRSAVVGAAAIVLTSACVASGYEAAAVVDGGTISGTVTYAGAAPAPAMVKVSTDTEVCGTERRAASLLIGRDGGVQNVVVRLADMAKGKPLDPPRNVSVDQKDCEYVPRVLLFPAGSIVRIHNSDGILHNVNTLSETNPTFNVAQPKFRRVVAKRIAEPEMPIRVQCDVHTWMRGWWISHEHPYYALTDGAGRFSLHDVPPGEYDLELWHETLGTRQQRVTVGPGETVTLTIALTKR